MNKNETLIFVHIPKTAGSTFNSILKRLYPTNHRSIFSVAQIEEFQQMPIAERSKIDLLYGHFTYGIHADVPRPSRYLTILREPIERVISNYNYICREPSNYLHKTVVENNISLAEFVNGSLTPEISNYQTRLIAGIKQLATHESYVVDEASLSVAKARLKEDFTAFGLTEKFDESLLLICRTVKWPLLGGDFYYERLNVANKPTQIAEIPTDVIDTIYQRNTLDIELYRYASDLFTKKIRSIPNLQLFLALFRALGVFDKKYRNLRQSSHARLRQWRNRLRR